MTETQQCWAVDLPNPHDLEGPWINVGYFDTKAEAVGFCRDRFGASGIGSIVLVTAIDTQNGA